MQTKFKTVDKTHCPDYDRAQMEADFLFGPKINGERTSPSKRVRVRRDKRNGGFNVLLMVPVRVQSYAEQA